MEQSTENVVAERAFNRATRIMNSWVNNAKVELTPAGKDWLMAALDPFHDEQLKNLQGWPDVETGSSTVRCIKQQVSFNATSGGLPTPTGPWNADVIMWPWLNYHNMGRTSYRSHSVVQQAIPTVPYNLLGGLQVFYAQNGQLDILNTAEPALGQWKLAQMFLAPEFMQGASRVIGIGFELRDTSAIIARQGTITSWKYTTLPRDPITFSWTQAATPTKFGAISGVEFRYPPVNTSEAMLMPGTQTRNSEEGSYMVGTFHSNENPPFGPMPLSPMIMPPSYDESTNPSTAALILPFPVETAATFPTGVNPIMGSQMCQIFPFHLCGIKISNANPLSSYNLTWHVYVERFPSLAELSELTIATPSAEFDAMALNIYSHAMSRMPVDVPVSMNPLGEWFQDLIETIGDWLTPLPGPLGAAGAIAKNVGTVTSPLLRPKPPADAPPVLGQKKKKRRNRNKNNNKTTPAKASAKNAKG